MTYSQHTILADSHLVIRSFCAIHLTYEIGSINSSDQANSYLYQTGYPQHLNQPFPELTILDSKQGKVRSMDRLEYLIVKKDTKKIPVVAITSSRESKEVNLYYDLVLNSSMVKPMAHGDFSSAMIDNGTKWLRINNKREI